ncbi:uncharacterized protein HaLaN_18984 [Haematococcus lacustris]|uniref:Uncharacterized protein n=1 Tax=Haematococcus lacustris TaxID=44745 RepID=A0A699ZSC0_HAELA|nr:uncharacterized protein HaLaN_18984 [Haematococcus lacustris]
MYHDPEFWDARNRYDLKERQGHIDWYCSYETLRPLFESLVAQPRCAALLVGSGTSSFPEELYDSGVKDVVVVERSAVAVDAIRTRNAKHGGRQGLRALHTDLVDLPLVPFTRPVFDLEAEEAELQRAALAREQEGEGGGPASVSPSQQPGAEGQTSGANNGSGRQGTDGEGGQAEAEGVERGGSAPGGGREGAGGQGVPSDRTGQPSDTPTSTTTALTTASPPAAWVPRSALATRARQQQQALAQTGQVLANSMDLAIDKTPGTLLLVSHSPPADRLTLLRTVYWHNIQVKEVCWPDLDDLDTALSEPCLKDCEVEAVAAGGLRAGQAFVYVLTK